MSVVIWMIVGNGLWLGEVRAAATASNVQQRVKLACDKLAEDEFEGIRALNRGLDPFSSLDIKIWVLDEDHLLMAHTNQPDQVGNDWSDHKDAEGLTFVDRIVSRAEKEAEGWQRIAESEGLKVTCTDVFFMRCDLPQGRRIVNGDLAQTGPPPCVPRSQF